MKTLLSLLACACLATAQDDRLEKELQKQADAIKATLPEYAKLRKALAEYAQREKKIEPELLARIQKARKQAFDDTAIGRSVLPLFVACSLLHAEALELEHRSRKQTLAATYLEQSSGLWRALTLGLDKKAFEKRPKTGKECAAVAREALEAARKSMRAESERAALIRFVAAQEFLERNWPFYELMSDAFQRLGGDAEGLAQILADTREQDPSLAARDAAILSASRLVKAWMKQTEELSEYAEELADDD